MAAIFGIGFVFFFYLYPEGAKFRKQYPMWTIAFFILGCFIVAELTIDSEHVASVARIFMSAGGAVVSWHVIRGLVGRQP